MFVKERGIPRARNGGRKSEVLVSFLERKRKIAKKKVLPIDLLSLYVFWYEWNNCCAYVFIHACGKFHVFSMYVMKLE